MPAHRSSQADLQDAYRSLLGQMNTLTADEALDADTVARITDGLPLAPDADGICPETARVLKRLSEQSETIAEQILKSDTAFLKKVAASGRDTVHSGAFGTTQAAYPVTIRNRVALCLFTGKIREKAFSKEERDEIASVAGGTDKATRALLADVPVYTAAQREALFALCARLRDRTQILLEADIANHDLAGQLLESERTRSLGTLSGGIAHHFNNLLSVILGYSSFLLNRETLSTEAMHAMRQISEAAQRGRRLTEELLSFAGSTAEKETICSVHEILRNVLSLLESQAAARVQIKTDLSAANDQVMAPRSSVHQVIFNLLTNAFDSMPERGRLAVATRNDTVNRMPVLRILVEDSSAPDKRRESADKPGAKLKSVYGMVSRMDGTATVSAADAVSGRAEIILPLAAPVERPATEKKVSRRLASSAIWIVDDDPIFREMCNRVLTDGGHQVLEISSGGELHERWASEKKKPDLLIIDFSMPEYNGLELCQWLKSQGSRAPVILVSGFSRTQPDISKALQMRKTYFLQKPFPVPELADSVTLALGETLIGDRPV